ncbi:MAG: tetratricopeptide (TPR) repeat protein [Lentimonas sp.]|jgi:tetratricopeptide (TPR) repeat protein
MFPILKSLTAIRIALFSCCCLASAQSFAQSNFATEQLLTIAEKEQKVYKRLAENPRFYSDADLERQLNALTQSYSTYLTDHPDEVEALILYGKLLRRMNQPEAAFNAFLKADEIDPQIAVVKQQIGTYLAETGKGKAALTFYLQAIELEPDTAVYHFALGQLLYGFKTQFIEEEIFTIDAIDRQMIKAFQQALLLEADNFDFQMRLGEAFYDLASPDWKSAMLHWNKVRKTTDTELRSEIIDLHRTRVLGKLGRMEEAKALLETIQQPSLQQSRQQVLAELTQF